VSDYATGGIVGEPGPEITWVGGGCVIPAGALAARGSVTALNSAVQQHLGGATVWIVDINPGDRMALYKRVGAQFVTMTAPLEELHARAAAERPERWHELINEHQAKAIQAAAGGPSRRPRSRHASGTC